MKGKKLEILVVDDALAPPKLVDKWGSGKLIYHTLYKKIEELGEEYPTIVWEKDKLYYYSTEDKKGLIRKVMESLNASDHIKELFKRTFERNPTVLIPLAIEDALKREGYSPIIEVIAPYWHVNLEKGGKVADSKDVIDFMKKLFKNKKYDAIVLDVGFATHDPEGLKRELEERVKEKEKFRAVGWGPHSRYYLHFPMEKYPIDSLGGIEVGKWLKEKEIPFIFHTSGGHFENTLNALYVLGFVNKETIEEIISQKVSLEEGSKAMKYKNLAISAKSDGFAKDKIGGWVDAIKYAIEYCKSK